MRKVLILILSFSLIILACKKEGNAKSDHASKKGALRLEEVQYPVVAGKFYPVSKSMLESTVKGYLNKVSLKPLSGDLMGIVVPHAGYPYSGQVAAYGFKELEGKSYDYVVVLAPSHHKKIHGAATRYVKYFETPLGKIPVAIDIVRKMVEKYDWIVDDEDAYSKEHSLEVELPFLQTVLKGFKLIPLIVGTHDADILMKIAGSLNEELPGKKVLYVVSTDLSHYHPYEKATAMDKRATGLLVDGKFDQLTKDVYDGKCELCGFGPLEILINLYEMLGGGEIKLLKYANSGDVTGDKGRVVGYASLAVISKFSLSDKEKKELLKVARDTLANHVGGKKVARPKVGDPYLMKPGAPFVTLKKNGQLRGCIGHIIARQPLAYAVQDNTIAAASSDPRFEPVRLEELKNISVEISVLTPLQPVYDPKTVQLGRDGLIIEKGMMRGVLLPQVPGEWDWTLKQYLDAICRKAGLPGTAINDPETKLYRFQALVFN